MVVQIWTWKDMRHTVLRMMIPRQMMRKASNNQTQTSDRHFLFLSKGCVARMTKPHFDEARVGSAEHGARSAHELFPFISQVDCFAEGAQLLKQSHKFSDCKKSAREWNLTDPCSDRSRNGASVPMCR